MRMKLHALEYSIWKLTRRWYFHWIFQLFKYSLFHKPMKFSYFKNVCYKLVSGHFQIFPPLAMEIWIWGNIQMRVKEKSWVQPVLTETMVWEKIIIKGLRHKYFWVISLLIAILSLHSFKYILNSTICCSLIF